MRPLSALGVNAPRRWTVTLAIVAVLGVMSLVTLLFPVVGEALVFRPDRVLERPWTLITFPFTLTVGSGLFGPFFTALLLFWTYQIGSSIENDQGQTRYLGFWALATLLPAALMLLPGARAALVGPSLPIAALTVVWATQNANMQILLMGLVPLAGKWIGALAALGIFAQYYAAGPLTAILSVVSLGIAWAWAAERIPIFPYRQRRKPSKVEAQREIDFMKEVAKRKDDRAEKERLRRLLEGGDDPISR